MSKKLSTDEFIEKARKIHNNKYDYSETIYINAKSKIKIICPKHGVFEQKPNNHLSGNGCFECFGSKNKTNSDFIDEVKQIHNNKYDYSLVKYINNKTKVKIICSNHGVFEQTPSHHLNKSGCPICANNLKYTNTIFIKKAKEIHGDKYDYSLVIYKTSHIKIKIICPEHSVFE